MNVRRDIVGGERVRRNFLHPTRVRRNFLHPTSRTKKNSSKKQSRKPKLTKIPLMVSKCL